MSVYNANTVLSQLSAIDARTNGFALHSDLNGPGFDAGKMVVAPTEGRLVLQFLFDVGELGFLHNHRELHPIMPIPREFLYARFAWAVFPLLARFLSTVKNMSVARNAGSVWTVTEEFARWRETERAEAGEKRRRRDDWGTSGGTAAPGDQDAMDCDFAGDQDSSSSTLSDNPFSEPAPLPSPPTALQSLFAPLPQDLERDKEELEEDYAVAREVFPQMLKGGSVHRDIVFYPGHRALRG